MHVLSNQKHKKFGWILIIKVEAWGMKCGLFNYQESSS